MRPLHADLTTAQKAASGTPYVVLMVDATDYSSRVFRIEHTERPYSGVATITLDNHDQALSSTDFRGQEVGLAYGYDTASGDIASPTPPMVVIDQQVVSQSGRLYLQLICMDLWGKLSLERLVGGVMLDVRGSTSGRWTSGMFAKVTACVHGNAHLNVVGRVDFANKDLVALTQVAYNSAGNATVGVGDTLTSLQNSNVTMTVTAVTSQGGGSGPAWAGELTILDIIQQLTSGLTTVVHETDDGIVDTRMPWVSVEVNAKAIDVIMDLMNRTKSYIRAQEDGYLHIYACDTDPSPDYTYQMGVGNHTFLGNVRSRRLVLPNRVIVNNANFTASGVNFYAGIVNDVPAQTQYGRVVPEIVFADVRSTAEAEELAASILRRVQMMSSYGILTAPMNCGQELFDFVRVVDGRSGVTSDAWVGGITRVYQKQCQLYPNGQYTIQLELGDLQSRAEIPGTSGVMLPQFPVRVPPADDNVASGNDTARVEMTYEGLVFTGTDALLIFRVSGLADGGIYASASGLVIAPPGAVVGKKIYLATDVEPMGGSQELGTNDARWDHIGVNEINPLILEIPQGAPGDKTGRMWFDPATGKLWVYDGSSWLSVTLT